MLKLKLLLILTLLIVPVQTFAQEMSEEEPYQIPLEAIEPGLTTLQKFYKAEVLEVIDTEERKLGSSSSANTQLIQNVKIKLIEGPETGKELEVNYETLSKKQEVGPGDKVVVAVVDIAGQRQYEIVDQYRMPPAIYILVFFFLLVIGMARWKGLFSMLGLAFSIFVLFKYVVPQIMAGKSPLLVALIGSFIIAFVSIYLAHGFNKKTSLALLSTFITLIIAGSLAFIFVPAAKLFGIGSEETLYLSYLGNINMQGLLLGGIIIGMLGVLDDVTTTQTATIAELKKANPNYSLKELYSGGLSVGREHITSLVNTLVLAYAGASLPMFLLFYMNQQPMWVVFNSEFLIEEIIRSLVGSIALILAVPISTIIAAKYYNRLKTTYNNQEQIAHRHIH